MAGKQRSNEVQRWTAESRAELAISLVKGETTAAEAARRHVPKVAEAALRARLRDASGCTEQVFRPRCAR